MTAVPDDLDARLDRWAAEDPDPAHRDTPAAELAHRRIRVPDRQKARIAARVLARGRRGGRR